MWKIHSQLNGVEIIIKLKYIKFILNDYIGYDLLE